MVNDDERVQDDYLRNRNEGHGVNAGVNLMTENSSDQIGAEDID